MGFIRHLRLGLFVFECMRFLFMAAVFVHLQPQGPWMLFAAPNVLFPLMALFLWLDFFKHDAYVPLYFVGKVVCVFASVGWSLVSYVSSMAIWSETRTFEWIFLSSDLFAIAVLFFILKNAQAAEPKAAEGE